MSREISGASLGTVNRSRPQLLHSTSQQSIAASDDYYSFSDGYASSSSRVTVVRYATPPSRNLSPAPPPLPQDDRPDSEMTIQPNQNNPTVMVNGRPPTGETVQSPTVETVEDARSPLLGAVEDRSVNNHGATTPGLSDEPYLRFAIEQLTRDEELSGTGRQGSVASSDYPVQRPVPDEGLGYYTNTNTQPNPPRAESLNDDLDQSPRSSAYSATPNVFIAADPPDNGTRCPELDFLPTVLRPFSLVALILLCLGMIAALIFSNIWSDQHNGLWDYNGQGGPRYFVFQYLPQLLAAFLILWTFVIQSAVYRILPLSIMASDCPFDGALQNLSIIPKNFLVPDLSHFKHGEASVGVSLFIMWLTNFVTLPLQSCLFQVQYLVIDDKGTWRWVAVQGVAWTLVALYALLVVALLLLTVRFIRGKSGLMWDPVSLADIIPLIQRSNVLQDFHRSETTPDVSRTIPPRNLRLGYWQTSQQPEVFYGIGEEHAPLREYSMDQGQIKEKKMNSLGSDDFDIEQQRLVTDESFRRDIHSPFVRYRWTTWFLRDSFVPAWIAIVIVLLVAFIVVSFVKGAIPHGFLPRLPTLPSSNGFSSSNFLYSFIPSLIGNFFFLAWQPIDTYFRAVQPFASATSTIGTTAEESLLLSYPSSLPVETTIVALFSKHYKLAWISFISLASLGIPILAGGVFSALYYVANQEIRISAHMPSYYALIAFCSLYALSFLIIWPRRKRYLPHDISTLADLVSFFYQSPLLSDDVFREPRSKADLVTRIIVAPPGETGSPRYAFGTYVGRDGKEHLGFDRFQRPGKAEMVVVTPSMK
ncbi:hypothetical protein FQN54_008062 [Arachnomyces sp. PD_36]|nr:hypothetical protein FQN54_008062 [Arachnomyces sp. PD_36]